MSRDLLDYLNEVDYKYLLTDYRPSQFALEFVNFIKLVNGSEGEEHASPVIHYDMIDQLMKSRQNLFVSFRGSAKALALDTLVMTPTGYVPMRYITVGDLVIDRNGEATEVVCESGVFTNQCYRITLADGNEFIANEDHYHVVQRRTQEPDHSKPKRANGTYSAKNVWVEEELTTKEILAKGPICNENLSNKSKWYIPLINKPVEFNSEKPQMDPYTVGVILGDGGICKDTGAVRITSHVDDVEELMSYIPYELGEVFEDKRHPSTKRFGIVGIAQILKKFIGVNDTYSKEIPEQLLFGSIEDRIRVLQGLMDTDGSITPQGSHRFISVSKALAQGVEHIVKSLGGYCKVSHYDNAYAGYYTVAFSIPGVNPFRLKRKAARWQNKHYMGGERVGIVAITPIGEAVESKCISVASDTRTFLLENSVITRNTTALHEYMILYLATYGRIPGFGEVHVGMYISDTIDNGVKSMRTNLQYRWSNSEFLQLYVPVTRFTDVRWEFENVEQKKLCFRGFGASTGVRGFKEYGKRPTWVGYDDLMSDKNAESATITKDIKHIIYKAARQALHPSKRMQIWTGTPFNKADPLYEATANNAWNVRTYPICEKFPCTEEEFQGAWEDRFSYDFVKHEYESLLESREIASFNQELMLRITSDEDRLIQDHDLVWYERKQVLKNRSSYNFYITTDLATSNQEKSDFTVIGVWAYSSNHDWMLVDGICARQLMDKSMNDLFRFVSMYKPLSVGIEINGQQGGFIQWMKNEMLTRKIFFSFAGKKGVEGIRRTRPKIEYMKTFLPVIKAKKLWLPEEMRDSPLVQEILEEFRYVTTDGFKSKNDDASDMVTMLQELDPFAPTEEVNVEYLDSEDGNFAFSSPEDDKDIYKNNLVF